MPDRSRAAIAAQVGRAADAVRKWPVAYPAEWAAVQVAEHRLLAEATAESVLTLRRQLRSNDDKADRDTAQAPVTQDYPNRPMTNSRAVRRPGS